jgi:CheY-like chemotaxis protein
MRIMFIDDERRRQHLYVEELEENGHEVDFQESVDPALAILCNPANHFDLVVLDISMPPGDSFAFEDTLGGSQTGLPFYDRIRKERPGQKVVALTNVLDARVSEHLGREDPKLCKLVRKPDTLPFQFAQMVEEFVSGIQSTDD